MADVKWIKIVTDIFDDEKILLIESLPEADSVIVIWFKLLCLAGKNNNSGVFTLNDKIPYTDEMLATIFRRPLNTVRMALRVFEQYGMIEIINKVITIPNWGKHQNLDKLEAKTEYMRKYMQEYRQKQLCKTNSKTNSKANVSEADKDIELDENKNTKTNPLDDYTDNGALKEAFLDFQKMRKQIKAAMTDRAVKLAFKKLDELATTDGEKIQILEQSIMNSWKGLFPLKEQDKPKGDNIKLIL